MQSPKPKNVLKPSLKVYNHNYILNIFFETNFLCLLFVFKFKICRISYTINIKVYRCCFPQVHCDIFIDRRVRTIHYRSVTKGGHSQGHKLFQCCVNQS